MKFRKLNRQILGHDLYVEDTSDSEIEKIRAELNPYKGKENANVEYLEKMFGMK